MSLTFLVIHAFALKIVKLRCMPFVQSKQMDIDNETDETTEIEEQLKDLYEHIFYERNWKTAVFIDLKWWKFQ